MLQALISETNVSTNNVNKLDDETARTVRLSLVLLLISTYIHVKA